MDERVRGILASVLVGAAVLLVGGGMTVSLGVSGDANAKLRLLAQVASPFTVSLALAALLIAGLPYPRLVVAGAVAVALAVVLLAVNGILLDLTDEGRFFVRIGTALSRLGAVALGTATLWLAARRSTGPGTLS